MPKLSIITPSYQQAQFLEQTIRSVLDQGVADVEYFVIDGGSDDGSVAIIERYADRLTGWVSEPDRGQAHALNKGLERASADIIGWINSDDYYLPGAFDAVLRAFEQHPDAGLIYGDTLSVNAQGSVIHEPRLQQYQLKDLMTFQIINQPAVFFRREAFLEVGGMDESYRYLLDHHLWLRIAKRYPVLYLPRQLAAARFHADAKNLKYAERFGEEAFRLVTWMSDQDAMQEDFARHKDEILAGAYRLSGYYFSEAGQIGKSLQAYAKAAKFHPQIAAADWRRILYTLSQPVLGRGWKRS